MVSAVCGAVLFSLTQTRWLYCDRPFCELLAAAEAQVWEANRNVSLATVDTNSTFVESPCDARFGLSFGLVVITIAAATFMALFAVLRLCFAEWRVVPQHKPKPGFERHDTGSTDISSSFAPVMPKQDHLGKGSGSDDDNDAVSIATPIDLGVNAGGGDAHDDKPRIDSHGDAPDDATAPELSGFVLVMSDAESLASPRSPRAARGQQPRMRRFTLAAGPTSDVDKSLQSMDAHAPAQPAAGASAATSSRKGALLAGDRHRASSAETSGMFSPVAGPASQSAHGQSSMRRLGTPEVSVAAPSESDKSLQSTDAPPPPRSRFALGGPLPASDTRHSSLQASGMFSPGPTGARSGFEPPSPRGTSPQEAKQASPMPRPLSPALGQRPVSFSNMPLGDSERSAMTRFGSPALLPTLSMSDVRFGSTSGFGSANTREDHVADPASPIGGSGADDDDGGYSSHGGGGASDADGNRRSIRRKSLKVRRKTTVEKVQLASIAMRATRAFGKVPHTKPPASPRQPASPQKPAPKRPGPR